MAEDGAAIAIALLVAAASLVTAGRWRRMRIEARRDARLLEALRAEIALGRLPEARDRVRTARGPLARVLLAVLRFPYGVHERALELARRDGLAAERLPGRGSRRALQVLSGCCAALGAALLLAPESAAGAPVPPAWLGLAGAGAILLLRSLDARRARDAARRLESESGEIARRIVSAAESAGAADAERVGSERRSAVEVGAWPRLDKDDASRDHPDILSSRAP